MSDLHIAKPLTLKCGLTLPNRLVKAAMAEKLGDSKYLPKDTLHDAYRGWSEGGWGLVMTGNVQVDAMHLGGPNDVAFDSTSDKAAQLSSWKAWAEACTSSGTPTIVQINHPGRQSPMGAGKRGLMAKTLAPSAVPLRLGDGFLPKFLGSIVFGTPKEMTAADIEAVVKGFADTARLAHESGFAGCEIHAAHGYLLAQFLSDKVNHRTDAYGGSPEGRAKIVVDVIHAIRAIVPQTFCIGIKLNSADHQSPTELQNCVKQLQLIAGAGIDFLEISGGTYEEPTMNEGVSETKKSESTQAREAFFIEFATTIRKDVPEVPLMVTGGFRSRKGMEAAVSNGGCDLVGVGRPAVLKPTMPKDIILNPEIKDEDATVTARKIPTPWIMKQTRIRGAGASVENTWYSKQIAHISSIRSKA